MNLPAKKRLTDSQVELVKRTLCPKGISDDELALFIAQVERTGLDPFSKQIYAIPGQGRISFMVAIDGLRVLAERSWQYAGQVGPFWCGKDGVWKDVWLGEEPPFAAKVGVIRKDFRETIWGVARYSSYAQNTPIWKKGADFMLAKCAESSALRKAFPNEMSTVYIQEECGQDLGTQPGNVTHPFFGQALSGDWELVVPDELLPAALAGEKISLHRLATDDNLVWVSKSGQSYTGRQILHFWVSDKQSAGKSELGKRVLEAFPSNKGTCLQNPNDKKN